MLLDIGSGSGFPGIPLAIATDLTVRLAEADRRKGTFLRESLRATKRAGASVSTARIEDLPPAGAQIVTARALAPLKKLLGMAAPHLAPDGICLFPKGHGVSSELTDAEASWQVSYTVFSSRVMPDSVILRISELARGASP